MSAPNNRAVSVSSLMSKDIGDGYFFPYYPATYCSEFRIRNSMKWQRFDYPPWALQAYQYIFPFRPLSVFGNEVPVMILEEPPLNLREHWKKWMPDYQEVVFKNLDEALEDDAPAMTYMATQMLPEHKHLVNPDLLYKLQLKSTIGSIDVPSPRNFPEDDPSFPCLVKVDQSAAGLGICQANNQEELSRILKKYREQDGWTGGIVTQEVIQDILEVPCVHFYLSKTGEVVTVGCTVGGFKSYAWSTGTVDWQDQDYYLSLLEKEFTQPIAEFLRGQGYFGFVNYDIVVSKHGKYLVDLNPRIGGSTAHLLAAKRMAEIGLHLSYINTGVRLKGEAREFIEQANRINTNSAECCRVIVQAAADLEDECLLNFSVFANSQEALQAARDHIINFRPTKEK